MILSPKFQVIRQSLTVHPQRGNCYIYIKITVKQCIRANGVMIMGSCVVGPCYTFEMITSLARAFVG